MDTSSHNQQDLFSQLGLPNGHDDIANFIAKHSPLMASIALDKANFWSPGQMQFIQESLQQDSEWAEIVDQLDAQLR